MKSRSEFKTISKKSYPKWIDELPVSKKATAEDYLNSFAKFCIKELAKKNIGDSSAMGKDGIKIHISDTRGRSNKNYNSVLGQCHYLGASATGETRKVEISRELDETVQVLMVTAHEITHAVLNEGTGHKGEFLDGVFGVFKQAGIPTATTVSAEFIEVISGWLKRNGKYPYTRFIYKGKKQSTRQIKCVCNDIWCEGTSDKARLKGHGTVFYMSSGVLRKVDDITCPVCQGVAYIESDITIGSYV
jgi:hypothetical protein|tara:strand:+ start:289 stop:1026 length:738 start_codon:yes stop_codon:yes gene_type:complete